MESQPDSSTPAADTCQDNNKCVPADELKIPTSAGVLANMYTADQLTGDNDIESEDDSPKEETRFTSSEISIKYEN